MPPELQLAHPVDAAPFVVLQDEWYQDVRPPDLGELLRGGLEWIGVDQSRWSLPGREIYVLARHNRLNGFIATARLTIGVEHVVLCTQSRLGDVEAALEAAGCLAPTRLAPDSGPPAGWCALSAITPTTPVTPIPDSDILNALRPLAEVEIVLEGGIRLERRTWLDGFPPSIRLRGDTRTIDRVLIDGQDAAAQVDGSYTAPGWAGVGEHQVWCTSQTLSYAISPESEEWESWSAYEWSLGEASAQQDRTHPTVCGVLVRAPRAAANSRAVVVPASNPLLIGVGVGEIAHCAPRSDIRSAQCVGFPDFSPAWALPVNPLHCDKRTSRILLVGSPTSVAAALAPMNDRAGDLVIRHGRSSVNAWCSAILAASQKGLRPDRSDLETLWNEFRRRAKALRSSLR